MSERQSILRMKVVGTETVKSDLASLEAAVRRQNTNFQRAFQVAEQKVRGGTPDANAAQENAQSMARQLAGTQALYNMTKKAREEGARAQLETRSEKEYVAAEMAKIKAVDVRTKQETKISQQAAKEKAAADQSYYKFTETMGERKLRILTEEYNRQRQLHAGNAQALARIDEAYARQRNAILLGGTGGGLASQVNADTIQMGAFGALTQMGSRRIMRQGIGMMAQQMLNLPGIGQQVGLAAGGFLYGGPILGTAAIGASAIARGYQDAVEGAKNAEQATKYFSDALVGASSAAAKLAGEFSPITKFGTAMESQADAAMKSIFDLSSQMRTIHPSGSTAWHTLQQAGEAATMGESYNPLNWIVDLAANAYRMANYESLNTGQTRAITAMGLHREYQEGVLKASMAREEESRGRAQTNQWSEYELRREAIGIESERATPERERKAFDQAARARAEKLRQTQEEQSVHVAGVVEDAKMAEQAAYAKWKALIGPDGLSIGTAEETQAAADVWNATRKAKDIAEKRLAELPGTQQSERTRNEGLTASERAKMQAMQAQKKEDLQTAYDREFKQNEIALTTRGWGQQREATIEKYRQRAEDEKKAGTITTNLNALMNQELAKQDKDHYETFTDTLTAMADQKMVANRTMLEADAQWAAQERSLYKQWGDGAAGAIRQTKDAFMELQKAQADRQFTDTMRALGLQIGLSRGTVSTLDAARESLRFQHPLWDQEQINRGANRQREAESAQWAKPLMARLHPLKEYEEFKEKALTEASIIGSPDALADARRLAIEKAQSLLGPRQGGEFMDAISYSRSIQSKVSADASIPKEQLAELKKIADDMRLLIQEGTKVRV